jgi:hypothetical protein
MHCFWCFPFSGPPGIQSEMLGNRQTPREVAIVYTSNAVNSASFKAWINYKEKTFQRHGCLLRSPYT